MLVVPSTDQSSSTTSTLACVMVFRYSKMRMPASSRCPHIRRLASLSREFADLWARHEVADCEPRTLTYQHPLAGALSLTVSELHVPLMPEARIVVYTPRDADTRARLPLTRRDAVPLTPAEGPVTGTGVTTAGVS